MRRRYRLGGLDGAPLRAAHHPGDRKPGKRFGQTRDLCQPRFGQVRIRPLAVIAAQRQPMPDQKQLHARKPFMWVLTLPSPAGERYSLHREWGAR